MNIRIPKEVDLIINSFYKDGYEAFAVGGCVRDSVLGRIPNDWDITTNALPERILSIFEHTIPTGIKHGTVTVVLDKKNFEVTTYRIDGEYSDNRHPDKVLFTSSLEEDLSRRDFTVNALAYNATKGLVDPFQGLKDLGRKIIRSVGNPNDRFQEDALRMIRAIRFSCQLNFTIDEKTFEAIKNNNRLIQNVSAERIREEFCKILLCDKPSLGILALKDSGLLKHVLPEIMDCIGFDQRNPHHDKDIFIHTLSVIDFSPKDLAVRLAALLHDIGKPSTFSIDEKGIGHFYGHEIESVKISEKLLRRLKFDNATINKVLLLVQEHMTHFTKPKNSSLKKLISRVGIDSIKDLFALQRADISASAPPHKFDSIDYLETESQKIIEESQPISIKDLAIKGSDLMAIGFNPGIILGKTLNSLLETVLENPKLNTRDTLISIAKEILSNQK